MPSCSYECSLHRWLRSVVVGAVALLFSLACAARGEDRTTATILVLHSNQRATPAQVIIEDSLRTALAQKLERPVQVFSEYLDDEWISLQAYGARQAEFLREKYEPRRIQVIVADAAAALQFLRKFRDQIAVGVPVVYLAVARDRVDVATLPADFIGVLEDNDPAPTLQLALRLHPGTKRVVLIRGGSEPARVWEQRMRAAAAGLGSNIDAQHVAGLPHEEVLQRVRALEPGALVFTPGYFNDGTGKVFTPRDSIQAIAAASAVPVYGAFDTQVGTGIVGGYMTSYQEEAQEAGDAVMRILEGVAPAEIPSVTAKRVPVVDWRQMRRWQIDDSLLPAGAAVRFHEPTVWERYRVEISIGVTVLLLQAALISALLMQRTRRHAAETASSRLAGRLLTAHEDERRRLARDLHDDVTQRLARLAIDASALERHAPGLQGKVAARAVREDLVRLSEDVHALSYRLHPSVIDDLGLAEAIKSECSRLATQEAIAVNVDVDRVPDKLPRESSLCLFRVAQEALRNVIRHADANAVDVSLVHEHRGLRLVVRDDGRGFDASDEERNPSLGHVSMRERVRQVGGSLRIDTRIGAGTTVSAWVPLRGAA